MTSRASFRRSLLNSASISLLAWSIFVGPGGVREVMAQPAAPKPSASIAASSAPSALPAPSAAPVTSASAAPPAAPSASDAASPAPSTSPNPETPPAEKAPPDLNAQWRSVFERGKAALAAGAFPLAARMLNDVVMRAPDPALREQARELAQLASYWSYNRMALMPAANTLPPNQRPKAVLEDKRSIDELAILYANTLVWGTGFGMVIGFSSSNSSAASFFLPAIGMTALGAGTLAYVDVVHGPLPYGVPQSITSGMYMGLEAGIYMVGILETQDALQQNEDKVIPGLIWGAATAGGLVGGLVGATIPVTPGRASFTSSGAIWGGVLTSLVTIGFTDQNHVGSAPFITGMIGAAAGGVTTGLLGSTLSPSIARVRFIDVGTFAGGLAFGGLYASLADSFDDRAFAFLTSAGLVAGLATSTFFTKDMDTDEPRRGKVKKAASWRATPFMNPQRGGGTIGFAGTF